MNIKPLHDRIVVKRTETEKVTAGGIVLAGNAAEKPHQGITIAVGTGKYLENGSLRDMQIAVGDKVLFGKNAGGEVTIEGETVIIMREEEVLAVLG